jgi:hypothetical protein
MPDTTPKLALPFLLASQADKHVTVNSALATIDTLVHLSVSSQTTVVAPVAPTEGQVFIITDGAQSGVWASFSAGALAKFDGSIWATLTPNIGWIAFVQDESRFVVWTGTLWLPLSELVGETGRKNHFINASFEIWQRGDSHTLGTGQSKLTADRWRCEVGASGSASVSRVALQNSFGWPVWVRDGLKLNQSAASTTGTAIEQRIEDVTTISDQPITVTFWARASAALSVTPKVTQNFGSGGTNPVVQTATAVQLKTTWDRYKVQINIGALSGAVIGPHSFLSIALVGPINQTFWIELVLPTCEPGPLASIPRKPAPGETLRQCQRYFCKTFPTNTPPASNTQDIGGPFESAYTNVAYGNLMSWQFPVQMRKLPSISTYNPYSATGTGMAIAGSGNYAVDIYALSELGVLLRNTQALGFAPTPVNLHVAADAEL